jgi:hypothetical protein
MSAKDFADKLKNYQRIFNHYRWVNWKAVAQIALSQMELN